MGSYDYIVVGAGSAGCAVAARLAADESRTVLLIEAGGSDFRLSVRAPLAYSSQMGGATDWGFETEPEPGCADRRMFQPRGKVLGGTSAMNAMVWVRGSAADYDGWRVPGWSWREVAAVFRKIESHYLGAPNHGTSGPVRVTQVAVPDEVSRRFVEAAHHIGIKPNDDIGGPDLDGAAVSPVNVWRGRRWSTARAYLDQARKRKNLTVVSNALARHIVIENGRAMAVEYERRGRRHLATARGEIVLSGGAFGTPHLLQISGIGPAAHLRDVGITPVVDSPNVGANLADHPSTYMNWELAPGFVGLADAKSPRWLLQWLVRGDGKLASNFMEAVAHVRSPRADRAGFPAHQRTGLRLGLRAGHPPPARGRGHPVVLVPRQPWQRARTFSRPAPAPGHPDEHPHPARRRRGVRASHPADPRHRRCAAACCGTGPRNPPRTRRDLRRRSGGLDQADVREHRAPRRHRRDGHRRGQRARRTPARTRRAGITCRRRVGISSNSARQHQRRRDPVRRAVC